MYLTKSEYEILSHVVAIAGYHRDKLTEPERGVLTDAVIVIADLHERHTKEKESKAAQVREKRKLDPSYAGADWYKKKKKKA